MWSLRITRATGCLALWLCTAGADIRGQTANDESQTLRFRGFASATQGVTSNLEFDRRSDNAIAAMFSGGVRLDHGDLRVTYELAKHTFSMDTRRARVSQALDATYSRSIARRWRAQITGDLALNGSPDSRSPVGRAYTLAPRLIYRGRRGHRVQVFTVHQARQSTDDPRDNAIRQYVGAEYHRSLGARRFWETGARVEWNDGADDRNDARRSGGWVEYGFPLGRRGAFRARADYRVRDFAARFSDVPAGRVLRTDRRLTAGGTWIRPLSEDIEWRLDYEFESNVSNDPRRSYNAHMASSRVTVAFP